MSHLSHKLSLAAAVVTLATLAPAQTLYGPYGSGTGTPFSYKARGKIEAVKVQYESTHIANMAFTYRGPSGPVTTPWFGTGTGSKSAEFKVNAGEVLSSIEVFHGTRVHGIWMRTSGGRSALYGATTGTMSEATMFNGEIMDFRGVAGASIGQLGVVIRPRADEKSTQYGKQTGTPFVKVVPHGSRIKQVNLLHNSPGSYILNMYLTYDRDGKTSYSGNFGKTTGGGRNGAFVIPNGEYLSQVKVWYVNNFNMWALELKTNTGRTQVFGNPDNRAASATIGRPGYMISGFFGVDSGRLDGIGCYLRPVAKAATVVAGGGCQGSGGRWVDYSLPAYNMTNDTNANIGANGFLHATGGFRGPAKIRRIGMRTSGPGSATVSIWKADANFRPTVAGPWKTIYFRRPHGTYWVDYPLDLKAGNYIVVHRIAAGMHPIARTGGKLVRHFHQDRTTKQWVGPFKRFAWKFQVMGTAAYVDRQPLLTGTAPKIGSRYQLTTVGARPSSPAGMILGLSKTMATSLAVFGRPDCRLVTPLDLITPFQADANGRFVAAYDIPHMSTLVGLRFYGQAFVARPGAQFVLDALSNGVVATVGY